MTTSRTSPTRRRSLLTGLLGQGIGPSLTPELHEREGSRHGLRYVYKSVELGPDTVRPEYLRQLLDYAAHLGFDGFNVTHPVKQAVMSLVDRLTSQAAAIGALNTIVIRDGVTVGHNTDVTGFGRALREGLPGVHLNHVVLLGAGGAGAAVAHSLAELGTVRLDIVDPDTVRTEKLLASVRVQNPDVQMSAVAPDRLAARLSVASGLINATPVGMAGYPGMPCPADLLRESLWVVDIIYRPLVTELLRAARSRGCRTMSGARMAVHQAADTFELITDLVADRAAMFRDFDEIAAAETSGDSSGSPAALPSDSRPSDSRPSGSPFFDSGPPDPSLPDGHPDERNT